MQNHQVEKYIFASCKSWHRPLFDDINNDREETWFYVSNTLELREVLLRNKPRYIFFMHWNWSVPEDIWSVHECVCFHMTDLPYGRGGSPLQNLILAHHAETMLSAIRMVKEIDAGPVYIKKPLGLGGSAEEIYVRAGRIGIEIIKWMIKNKPKPLPQKGDVVMFKRRKPEQSCLPNNGSIKNVYDFIRMLDADGYPHAFIEHGEYKIIFRNARIEDERVFAEIQLCLTNKTNESPF